MPRSDGCSRVPAVSIGRRQFERRRTSADAYAAYRERFDLEHLALEPERLFAGGRDRDRVRLEPAGRQPPFSDGRIAAACVHDLVLVTGNRADDRRFQGLRVESWG